MLDGFESPLGLLNPVNLPASQTIFLKLNGWHCGHSKKERHRAILGKHLIERQDFDFIRACKVVLSS